MDARYAALTGVLGLSVRDLAEIGGFSDRFARYLVSGGHPYPEDVRDALDELDRDSDMMVDTIVADVRAGAEAIWIFRTNEDLRAHFPDWPGRGHAPGGFVGPHRIAALTAADQLAAEGIHANLIFFDAANLDA